MREQAVRQQMARPVGKGATHSRTVEGAGPGDSRSMMRRQPSPARRYRSTTCCKRRNT